MMTRKGRPPEYERGTKNITLSLDCQVLRAIDKISKKMGISKSKYCTNVIRSVAFNDHEYARIMAKIHSIEFHYWRAQMDRIQFENNEIRGR